VKHLGNDRNIVRTATVTATNHQPSTAHYATEIDRDGGGLVSLSGDFNSQNDATYDVEILNNTIVGVPRVSEPVASGVGNAVMSAVSAPSGLAAQTITATLVDLGTETRAAYTPFQGVTLRARVTGPDGNDLIVLVDESGLTTAATDFSILSDLPAGTAELEGQQWNFGAALLDPDGNVPASAPRIRVGFDPQEYRQYRDFRNGAWFYSFAPRLVRPVTRGTPVLTVSGSRTVTIRNTTGYAAPAFQTSHAYSLGQAVQPITPNGYWYRVKVAGTSAGSSPTWTTTGADVVSGTVTFEDMGKVQNVYTNCTTLYSLLTQIEADATGLVSVDEPVTANYAPGGMATLAINEQTQSFLASLDADGTPYVESDDIDLTVASDAPTEILTIKCIDASERGAERWAVEGSASGAMAEAVTGVAYDGEHHDFTIPVALPDDVAPAATLVADLTLMTRSEEEQSPTVCVKQHLIGAEARTKRYTFVWSNRPSEECECKTNSVGGTLDPSILGLDDGGEEVSQIPAPIAARAEDLSAWYAPLAAAAVLVTASGETRRINANPEELEVLKALHGLMYGALRALHDAQETPATPLAGAGVTEWDDIFTDLQADFPAIDVDATDGDTVFTAETSFTADKIETILEKWRARLVNAYTLAGIEPDFDEAGSGGNPIWQDSGDAQWFRSLDGLLPLQLGRPYYTAVMGVVNGRPTPVATREWGAIFAFGCPDQLKIGDQLIVDVTLEGGNLRLTYQPGDIFEAVVNFAAPMELGGGQTGTDTQTWRVEGSEEGVLDNYALSLITPNTYTHTGGAADGLTFLITPGSIDSALGDIISFDVEGGQFRWRKNGGAWSSATQIAATVSIGDGLSLVFTPGEAPSFAVGDAYSFAAEASFGPGKLQQPTDGALVTTSSTVIVITPADPDAPVEEIAILEHQIPSGATITLQGSDDNFATTPLNETLTWNAGLIHKVLSAAVDYAKYRLQISQACSVGWVFLGVALVVKVSDDTPELGVLTKRRRLKGVARRAGLGARVEYSFLTQESVDSMLDLLDHAGENDDGRFGIIPNDNESEGAIVTFDGDTLEIGDLHDFQPVDTAHRASRFALELTPIP
jgi:hypothetical protein